MSSTEFQQQPKISFIITPSTNNTELDACLNSILKQDISKEIIIVGNHNTQLPAALAAAQQYPYVFLLHTPQHHLSIARNIGLRAAKGEFILFINPQHQLIEEPNLNLNIIYNTLIQTNTVAAKGLLSTCHPYLPTHRFNSQPLAAEVAKDQAVVNSFYYFSLLALPNHWFLPIECWLLSRSFLLQHQLFFDEQMSNGAETGFILKLLSADGNMLEVPMPFVHYQADSTPIIAESALISYLEQAVSTETRPEIKFRLEVLAEIQRQLLNDTIS